MSEKKMSIEDAWYGLRRFEVANESLPVEGQATRVMLGLARYLDASGEKTRINLSQIARDTGLSRVAARNGLDRLIALGVVEVETVREGRPTNYCAYTSEFLEEVGA